MAPARAGLGLAAAGALLLLILGLNALPSGFQAWMSSAAVQGAGLLVAAAGAVGAARSHPRHAGLLAAGLLGALLGHVLELGFTLAWGGRTALYVAGALVGVAGMAQGAWYGALAASQAGLQRRAAFGLALGVATVALGQGLTGLQESLDGSLTAVPRLALVACLAVAARTLAAPAPSTP